MIPAPRSRVSRREEERGERKIELGLQLDLLFGVGLRLLRCDKVYY